MTPNLLRGKNGTNTKIRKDVMMYKLKCGDANCESHETNALFSISVGVDAWRDAAKDLSEVEPEHFTCSNCGCKAIEDDDGY